MSWTRGAVVGDRYRLETKVGAGGMGEVWAAEHIGVGTRVAMKTLLAATAKNHEMAARLKREAFFLGRIQSDHVARVLDFIDDDRWGLVLVMEFVEGDKLSDVLKQKHQLTVEETIELGADLASALSDLHRANVIHRDLKPANVILKPLAGGAWRAMIVDFGLSRLLRDDAEGQEAITNITGLHMALGTVEYMAPEQVLDSRDVTPASDLYALGALLYRAVAGRHVFGQLREGHMAHAKITREAPALETGRGDRIARGLESVVAHALAKRPADRYDRADLMLAELTSLRHLARSSAVDFADSDTEEGISESRMFELRQTMRMPVARDDAATGAGAPSAPAISQESTTLRVPVTGRQSTLRIPLSSTAAMSPAARAGIGVARRAVGDDEVTPIGRPRLPEGASTTAVSARLEHRRAEPEPPASVPQVAAAGLGISRALAVATAAGALLIGFAAGRVTAPAAPPAVVATEPPAPEAAPTVVTETAPPPSAEPEPTPAPSAAVSLASSAAASAAPAAPRPTARSTAAAAADARPAQRPAASSAAGPSATAPASDIGAVRPVPRPIDDPYQ
jgi:serine/threonine-protein kinase